MKKLSLLFLIFSQLIAHADTPPARSINSFTYNGAGTQVIGNVSDSLKVNITNTVPVTGTFFPATQPVSGNLGKTWNLSSGSDSVSSVQSGSWNLNDITGTVSLPTGAATALKQPSIGTAGTASSDVITVQGIASMTPFSCAQSGVYTVQQGTPPWSVSQSGTWTAGRTWSLSSGTDSTASTQSGTWTTGRTWSLTSGTDSVAVIGSVTANAGTNLNTSLLALDSTVAKDSSLGTLNTSVNTLLKPGSTLAAVTALGSITSALPIGTNSIGQVTSNAGTNLNTSLLALDSSVAKAANQTTLGSQTTKINDGTNTATVKAASTAPIATDSALVISQSPNSVIPNLSNNFARIKNKQFAATEEARYDIPASLVSGDIYMGVNIDGTATSVTTWTVVRTYFDANGNPSRERIKTGISWDARASGGNWP